MNAEPLLTEVRAGRPVTLYGVKYVPADPTGQRQDSLTDQMATVLRLAVAHGCYDAHDWLVSTWGSRHGICANRPELPLGDERLVVCVLTAGHDGAHEDDATPPCYWIEVDQ